MSRKPTFRLLVATLALVVAGCATGPGGKPAAVKYRCLFNHELLIICGNKTNSPAYMASFIDKLKDTELFPPLERNETCATRDCVKFFAVPPELLVTGENTIEIVRQDSGKTSCLLFSMELALII